MTRFTRWVVEIVLLVALVAAAVLVEHLTATPFWLTGLALVGSILAAHVALDSYQEAR